MLYVSSQATGDGNLVITATFALAPTSIRRRFWCRTASPPLSRVAGRGAQIGVTVRKNSPDLMMVIH